MDTRYTDIRLIKVPLEIDNKNQLTFASATAQEDYFKSLPYLEVSDSSYQRKDSTIRYPGNVDNLWDYNYVMYKNTNYINKWFYAYITDMRYINDNMTEITIKTDVWQTWQFDIEYKKCFIEREHVNDDTLGLHTVPENVETGEYVVNAHLMDTYNDDTSIISASTVGPSDLEYAGVKTYNGIPSGIVYCRWDTLSDLTNFINILANNDKSDALVSMFLAPQWLAPITGGTVYVDESSNPQVVNMSISRLSSLNGYTPKNNKLLTFPYCYIGLSNNAGQFEILKQEIWNLSNNEMQLKIYGALTPGGSMRAVPQNYRGDGEAWDNSITLGKFPQLNWNTDQFTNWLTQNGVNIGISVGASALSIVSGASTGNPIGVASGIIGIGQSIGQIYQHSLLPPSIEGNVNSGDVTTSSNANRLHAYRISIKQEYAKIIDNFFSMYGYKVNEVKIPNITGRQNWNYVKTIDCNIHAYIPQADCLEIKNMFNAGITLWHNPSTFLDYSQSNNIV